MSEYICERNHLALPVIELYSVDADCISNVMSLLAISVNTCSCIPFTSAIKYNTLILTNALINSTANGAFGYFQCPASRNVVMLVDHFCVFLLIF